jgi:hypothetical protein
MTTKSSIKVKPPVLRLDRWRLIAAPSHLLEKRDQKAARLRDCNQPDPARISLSAQFFLHMGAVG